MGNNNQQIEILEHILENKDAVQIFIRDVYKNFQNNNHVKESFHKLRLGRQNNVSNESYDSAIVKAKNSLINAIELTTTSTALKRSGSSKIVHILKNHFLTSDDKREDDGIYL
jgi:hypothetical protein